MANYTTNFIFTTEYDRGYHDGSKATAEKILRSLMDKYIKREDLNDYGYGADESITMNDLLELAEQFEIDI